MRINILKKQQIKRTLLAGIPLAVFGAAIATPMVAEALTTTTTVSSAIGSTISLLSSSGTVNINVTPTGAGVQTIAADTVTVSTNDSAGYTLKLGETSATVNLVGTSNPSNTIVPVGGSQAVPQAETANSWGYRVDSVGGFGAGPTSGAANAAISGTIKFAPVAATGSPDTIKTTAVTASNDTTSVWYGIAANTTAVADTYTNSVTYTATAN
jgi:hypothetical protein